jgi:hypothetical protein
MDTILFLESVVHFYSQKWIRTAQPSRRLWVLDVASLRTPVLETPLVDAFSIEMNQFHAADHDLQRYMYR